MTCSLRGVPYKRLNVAGEVGARVAQEASTEAGKSGRRPGDP